MDRPKHRRFVLLGLVLLAGGMLLVGRQWFFATTEQPIPVPAATVAAPHVETQPDEVEPATVEISDPSVAATASSATATTGSFRGKVIDSVTRRPVKEFEVRLIRVDRSGGAFRAEDPITRTFQSETGRFTWSDLTPSGWMADVTSPGYQLFNLGEVRIVAGKTTRETVMPLLRGSAVRGRVFERSTGAAIADAWVTFRETSEWRGSERSRSHTKSKADGSFVLEGVPGGEIALSISAKEHAPRELEITVDDKTQPQEIALSSGGTIAGMVTTADGTPVKAGVMVFGSEIGHGSQTDDAGQFFIKHLRAGRYLVSASGAGGTARQEVQLGEDERKDGVILTFTPGRSVRGVVRGLRPEQLRRTGLSLHGSGRTNAQARPDERGSYVFNGVQPGKAHLLVYAEGRQLFKAVEVPADQDITLDIVFPPGVRLSGRVTQAGQPAAQKWISIEPANAAGTRYRASTSEEGQYEVEDIVPGEYKVHADEDIYRPLSIAADTVLNIDIPSVQLGGSVMEDGGAVPIVGADVYVRGVEPANAHVHAYKATDDFGAFKLTGLEQGDIVLTAHKAGYEIYREKLAWNTPITNKKITLRRGGGIEVRAQIAAGKEPVRGFMLNETIPGANRGIDLWIPLDREGLGSMPVALIGRSFRIYGSSGKPIIIDEWDGQPLELKL